MKGDSMRIFIVLITVLLSCPAVFAGEQTVEDLFFDGYVYSPTRFLVPVGNVAENITVITSEDIERMNAHTVAEVLDRVPGLAVNFTNDFGAPSLISAHGSEAEHVAVKLDGIPWNYLSGGNAETSTIPVGIIDRIEIIKGPASSVWGSSLGGVVNILTKQTGYDTPHGELRGFAGERGTTDISAQLSGAHKDLSGYAFVGNQASDGLSKGSGYSGKNGFAKIAYNFDYGSNLVFSAGISTSETDIGDISGYVIDQEGEFQAGFASMAFSAPINSSFAFNTTVFYKKDEPDLNYFHQDSGELYRETIYDEEVAGAYGKLTWRHKRHSGILGFDITHGTLRQEIISGKSSLLEGVPPVSETRPQTTEWAVYTTGSFVFGDFVLIPGVRFDHNDISGSFFSPSLGMTCRIGKHSLLRASLARGFRSPPLSYTSGGGVFLDPNPSLEAESVWSYQVGIETVAVKYARFKVTLFYHDVDDTLTRVPNPSGLPEDNNLFVNRGSVYRKGVEFEAETLPFYDVSLWGNFTYTEKKSDDGSGIRNIQSANIGLKYVTKYLNLHLMGNYVRWDTEEIDNELTWDAIFSKIVFVDKNRSLKLVCSIRNLFNGRQPDQSNRMNPQRWAEAGIIYSF